MPKSSWLTQNELNSDFVDFLSNFAFFSFSVFLIFILFLSVKKENIKLGG